MTRYRIVTGLGAALLIPVLAACSGGAASIPPLSSASDAPSATTEVPSEAAPSEAAPSEAAPSEAAPSHPTTEGGMPEGCPTEQPEPLPAGETRTVTIETEQGSFAIEVAADLSPIAAGNFVALAECGYYDGVVFHRVAPGFVIQGGDGQFGRVPNVEAGIVGSGGPPYTIADEPVTSEYVRGTVAMAKTNQPNSASSQFFVVLQDLGDNLPKEYQIFGLVTEGMEVVDAISNLPNDGSQMSLAVDEIPMTNVTVATP